MTQRRSDKSTEDALRALAKDGTEPNVPVISPEMIAEAAAAEALASPDVPGVDWLRDLPDRPLEKP